MVTEELLEALKQAQEEKLKQLIPKLDAGYTARVSIKQGKIGCTDLQKLCAKQGYVDVYKLGNTYCIDDNETGEQIVSVLDSAYIEMYVCKVYNFTRVNRESRKLIEQLFLSLVCKNYACGSQRCDGSSEFLEGCQLYKDFEKSISDKTDELLSE